MKITIVLPFLNLTGGVRLMLQYGTWLYEAGHQVTIAAPSWPYRFHFTRRQQFGEFRRGLRRGAVVGWMPVSAPTVRVPLIRSRFLPSADVVVATSWPTAFDVAALDDRCGRKVHVVMHHEGGTGPAARLQQVYRLPLARLTLSNAVRAELRNSFRCDVAGVLPCAVDSRVFFPEGGRSRDVVLMLHHPEPRKGAADGLEVLARVRARMPHVNVECCSTVPAAALPPWVRFRHQPGDGELRRLFSTAAAFLYPSRYEGFGLPPLEAMACGCPVVATRVGAVPDFISDGANGLLADVGDTARMTDGLLRLLADPLLAGRLAHNALATAASFSVDAGARRFEKALLDLM
jgi:glycosyltransferase involved in cell wall biosynthesis